MLTVRSPQSAVGRQHAISGSRRGKYARPFGTRGLASASVIGTESWSDYGQVVLQMAILDTLLSIEDKLDQSAARTE